MTLTRSSGELLLCRTLLCTIQYKSWNVCGTLCAFSGPKKDRKKSPAAQFLGCWNAACFCLSVDNKQHESSWKSQVIIQCLEAEYSEQKLGFPCQMEIVNTHTSTMWMCGWFHIHIHKSLNTYTNTNIEVQWVLLCIGQYSCDIYRSKQFRLLETKVATKCVHMFGYASLLVLAASCMSTKATHS